MSTKPNLPAALALELLDIHWGVTSPSLSPLPSYEDENFNVKSPTGKEYVLKVPFSHLILLPHLNSFLSSLSLSRVPNVCEI